MKRMGLHLTNWIGFIVANAMLGRLWGMLFGYLFKGFLSDEAYAANHPKKFFLGTVGIMLLASVSSVVVIYFHLKDYVNSLIRRLRTLQTIRNGIKDCRRWNFIWQY